MSRFLPKADQSADYKAAVAALAKLNLDEANRAYADAVSERVMAQHTKGLRLVDTGSICTNRLHGKRCAVYNCTGCRVPHHDHATLWRPKEEKGAKPCVYISQPYGIGWTGLYELVDYCRKHDLTANVDAARSWHFPGNTLAVLIRAKES